MWILCFAVLTFISTPASCGVQFCDETYSFPCRKGGCTKVDYVCDGDDDCSDMSDEHVCGGRCPKWYYACVNSGGCYEYKKHCDGKRDCTDGSDEIHCPGRVCPSGEVMCADGLCVERRDSCCPVSARNGACSGSNFNVSQRMAGRTLIYANGLDLYSLNLGDNSKQLLHRSETAITALAYSSRANKLFWAVGPRIWSLSLGESGGEAQPSGEIRTPCSIAHMVYDWITGNFYFVCKRSRLVVCKLRPGDTVMLCTRLITVDMKRVTWFALDPNVGHLFIGGLVTSGSQIIEAEADGGNARTIYHSDHNRVQGFHLHVKTHEILILESDDGGYLYTFDAVEEKQRVEASKVFGKNTSVRALFSDLAILQQSDDIYALVFSENISEVHQKDLDIESTSRVFYLIDPDGQPMAENRCNRLECDDLCLLVSGGAVCKCGYRNEDAERPCELRRGTKEETSTRILHATSSTPNLDHAKSHGDCLVHVMYIAVIIVSATCGAVICIYILSRKKFYKAKADAYAHFDAEGSLEVSLAVPRMS